MRIADSIFKKFQESLIVLRIIFTKLSRELDCIVFSLCYAEKDVTILVDITTLHNYTTCLTIQGPFAMALVVAHFSSRDMSGHLK